jgi:hypothetical protein
MDNEVKEVSFALAKITTEQFAIIESNFTEKGNIQLQANIRFGADDQKKLAAVFTNFTFQCEQKPFLIIEVGCHFAIKPESWTGLLNADTNILTVPKDIMQHLAVLTVGTARGVLHAKTENTPYNQFFLPTINVAEMINQDQTFEFALNDKQ